MPPQKLPEGQHSFNIGNISQPGIYLLQVIYNMNEDRVTVGKAIEEHNQ